MSKDKIWHKGACHCGAVTFRVRAPKKADITDCNCSICDMTGFQHLIVEAEDFELLSGEDNIKIYTFGSHIAKHAFCKTCGVKPYYRPRSHPEGWSANLRCVDQSTFDSLSFHPFDGKNWEDNIKGLLSRDD